MLNRFFLLSAGLFLAACSATAVSNNSLPTRNPLVVTLPAEEKSDLAATLPEPQCEGNIPAPLKPILGEYQLANKSDFVAAIRAYEQANPKQRVTCSIFTADFNGDGLKDYALLLVNPKTRSSRFVLALNQGKGQFNSAVVKDFDSLPNSNSGILYTAMRFKPAGELGAAGREYSPVKSGTWQQKVFQAKPAIELWKALPANSSGIPQNLEVSTLAYCSDVFYFFNLQLKTFNVCD